MQNIKYYTIEKHKSGIIELTFNTKGKWLPYWQMNDYWYFIGESKKENYIEISKEDLHLDSEKFYISSEFQNKDQITFYFIPEDLLNINMESEYFKEVKIESE